MNWKTIVAPPDALPPTPWTLRVQSIPAYHDFAKHKHDWHQVVYAISGVLTVVADGQSFVISPDKAAWISAGTVHQVGSFLGAEYHSFWLADNPGGILSERAVGIFSVSPLLKALIVEAAKIYGKQDDGGYFKRIYRLVLDQLYRANLLSSALPWPKSTALSKLCETLYVDPTDSRGPEQWGAELGMSGRTLARRFLTETGMPLRTWRRQLRLFRAIELLESGMNVTGIALELGYSSTSAFIYAFRTEMKCSPLVYMQARATNRPGHTPEQRHGKP